MILDELYLSEAIRTELVACAVLAFDISVFEIAVSAALCY